MIRCLQKGFAKFLFMLLCFTAIGFSAKTFAQATFSAICPQKKIGKNEYIQVEFRLENASHVEAINPPSFKNFAVVSGPNQESGMTSVNGKVDQYVSVNYFLKPNGSGSFTIGSATAKADGKEFHSNPLSIEVTNSTSSSSATTNQQNALSPFANLNFDMPEEPSVHRFDDYILKKGESIPDKVKKNLFVRLDVNKTNCYVGEPIVASYKLYTRLRSESTVTDAPSFNGFSVSELDLNNDNAATTEKYNGRDYNVYTLRKVQLYPLQDGTITLDPVVTDNKVTFIKAEYAGSQKGDMFYDMLQNFADATSPQDAVIEQNVKLQSKPVQVIVKPLPVENKPVDFKGSVGNFTIQSSLQKSNITTDDAGNLKIIIAGAGNIQLLNAPKINWPQGIDSYDAKVTDNVDKLAVPMNGNKVFTYPFTVAKAGDYSIPPVSFSYFDPASSSYKTLLTEPLSVHVIKGKGIQNNPYIKNTSQAPEANGLIEKYGLYIIILLVVAGIIIFSIVQKNTSKKQNEILKAKEAEKEKNDEPEVEETFVIPENPLEDAHEKLMEENSTAFYNVLDTSVKKYLAAKFKVPAEELTKKRLSEELDKYNVGLGTSLRVTSLIENIELNLYAPAPSGQELKEVYEKASEVVSLLDKQVC